ncbi:MAG TPA: hypothetical protein PKN92_13185 [Candidatus Hydrogenedentes bacterium]|jgi:hypothetical protein|nr:hypothetical protein [Candidatus Hydrogenedentota bacterium]
MKKRVNDGLDPYQALANAVVQNAAEDYRAALKRLNKDPENVIAKAEVQELKRFFRSQWYEVLTEVDGEYLINMLEKEYPDVDTGN